MGMRAVAYLTLPAEGCKFSGVNTAIGMQVQAIPGRGENHSTREA
jgi:hypothetical protein